MKAEFQMFDAQQRVHAPIFPEVQSLSSFISNSQSSRVVNEKGRRSDLWGPFPFIQMGIAGRDGGFA
jgi:hypothetical protein